MIRRQYACARWAGLVCACVSAGALAQTAPPPDAQASDPARLGWMVGSPPPADKIVRKEDGSFYRFPQLRWTFSNARQLGATTNVSRGLDSPSALPRAERADRDAVTFVPLGMTEPMTWGQAFDANYTDGVVVLHKGRIVYERYAGVFKPDGQHLAQSLTKSFFGTIAAMLVADGQIDQNALVTQYVPELRGSAFADATVRQVMDMRTGLKYSENYADPKAEIWMHARAGNVLPRPPGYRGRRASRSYWRRCKRKASTAARSLTRRTTPTCWAGSSAASPASRRGRCCPSASGRAWAWSRTPTSPSTRWAPSLQAVASTPACAIWPALAS